MHTPMHATTHSHVHTHINIHTHTHTHTHTHEHANTCTRVHTHTHTARTHTSIHTQRARARAHTHQFRLPPSLRDLIQKPAHKPNRFPQNIEDTHCWTQRSIFIISITHIRSVPTLIFQQVTSHTTASYNYSASDPEHPCPPPPSTQKHRLS